MSIHFLEMDIEQLRAEVLKQERDKAALLAACKTARREMVYDWSGKSSTIDQVDAAIKQAES